MPTTADHPLRSRPWAARRSRPCRRLGIYFSPAATAGLRARSRRVCFPVVSPTWIFFFFSPTATAVARARSGEVTGLVPGGASLGRGGKNL